MCECGKKTCWNCEGVAESKQPKPHPHATLIKQWADNQSLKIQCRDGARPEWQDTLRPYWFLDIEYRIKPEPKPDVVRYSCLTAGANTPPSLARYEGDNVRAVFDGETGKLKKVEML